MGPLPAPARPSRLPRAAWAVVAAAVPVHLGLALATDLSPDEAYYLCGARLRGGIVDHPPLTLWLLALSDRWTAAPVELRVRVWAVAFSFATGIACVALARARGADREGCTLAAWLGSWALLPMAGGFVTTPDGPLLLAVALALITMGGPESPPKPPRAGAGRLIAVNGVAGPALFVGALAKVVALPIGALLAVGSRRASLLARLALALGPLAALPLLVPSLRFQLRHAYGGETAGDWSAGAAVGAVIAAVSAQALLWSPVVLWRGLHGLSGLPLADRVLVAGLSALVVASALVRGVPPEPNWWAPAALIVVAAFARSASGLSLGARRAILASVLVPTLVAAAHTARPFLPLPERADPTARLHGWSHGVEPAQASGVGLYGPAAERCVYHFECSEIRLYFDEMNVHEGSRP
jgi:hypothetical protein